MTFIVKDSGIGMSESYMSRIFMPFEQERSSFTEQYAGSGLGLSIVHNLVSLMNGSVDVESKEGKGTLFTVRLPLVKGQPFADMPKTDEPAAVRFDGKRALLAEDNAMNQLVAVSILKKRFGVISEVAENGRLAVEQFAASEEGYFDIVLMDVKMPEMDGLEATRRIRALKREDAQTVPILALSANAYQEDIALSITAGMNDYLAKPIDLDALSSALQKYL